MSLGESEDLEARKDDTRSPLLEFVRTYKWAIALYGVGLLFILLGAVIGGQLGGIMGAYGVVVIFCGVCAMIGIFSVRYRMNA